LLTYVNVSQEKFAKYFLMICSGEKLLLELLVAENYSVKALQAIKYIFIFLKHEKITSRALNVKE